MLINVSRLKSHVQPSTDPQHNYSMLHQGPGAPAHLVNQTADSTSRQEKARARRGDVGGVFRVHSRFGPGSERIGSETIWVCSRMFSLAAFRQRMFL